MKSLFEKLGGTYHKKGDYFLPDLFLPETAPVGIWGQRRKHYLKTQRGPLYGNVKNDAQKRMQALAE